MRRRVDEDGEDTNDSHNASHSGEQCERRRIEECVRQHLTAFLKKTVSDITQAILCSNQNCTLRLLREQGLLKD